MVRYGGKYVKFTHLVMYTFDIKFQQDPRRNFSD